MQFLGLVTKGQYIRDMNALRDGMAGALAMSQGVTIDKLREDAKVRKDMVTEVKMGKAAQIDAARKALAQMEQEFAHIERVESGLTAIVNALPEGVSVDLDPLVFQVAEPTEELAK